MRENQAENAPRATPARGRPRWPAVPRLAVAGVVILASAGCGGDADDDTAQSSSTASNRPIAESSPPDSSPVASATSPGESERAVADTSEGTAGPPPTAAATGSMSGLVVDDVVVRASFSGLNVAGLGDGFVWVEGGAQPTVARSVDGSSWEDIAADVGLDFVDRLVADERMLVAIGRTETSDLAASVSDDGGRSWSATSLGLVPPTNGYVATDVGGVAAAIAGGQVLVVATLMPRVDWERYSEEVLGADHGAANGESLQQTPDGALYVVDFEDGFQLSVAPGDVGVAAGQQLSMPVAAAVIGDGRSWASIDVPADVQQGAPAVVAGPGGFLTFARDETTFELSLARSADGANWSPAELPERFDVNPTLVGGTHGYLLVGEDVIFHSPDGVAWSLVHSFEDPEPEMMGWSGGNGPAASAAGFVVPLSPPMDGERRAQALVSPDGTSWEMVELPELDIPVAAASDTTLLLVPVRIDPAVAIPQLEFADDDEAVAAIAPTFGPDVVPGGFITSDEATCIARDLVAVLGRERLGELRFGNLPWHLLGYALAIGPFERADAESMVGVFQGCTPDWEQLMITSITQGADEISATSATCIARGADDTEAYQIFVDQLMRPAVSALDAGFLEREVQEYMACLTPAEQARMDWD